MIDWGWMGDHLRRRSSGSASTSTSPRSRSRSGSRSRSPSALAAVRCASVYPPATAIAGIFYTIPSLALFAAFVPITGSRSVTVEIPLVMYTLVILVRNIVAGFDAVPPDVLEAADGHGLLASQRLWQVELPLAVPLIDRRRSGWRASRRSGS